MIWGKKIDYAPWNREIYVEITDLPVFQSFFAGRHRAPFVLLDRSLYFSFH